MATTSVADCVPSLCDDPRCPGAIMRAAQADEHLFRLGAYLDDDGRRLVGALLHRGYPRPVATRIARQIWEARP